MLSSPHSFPETFSIDHFKPRRRRASPARAAIRDYRILGWLQAGLSSPEIAALEGVTPARARQIVAAGLLARQEDLTLDPRLLAELRLAPALRLAAKTITEGKLEGVDRLLKAPERVIKLRTEKPRVYDENARAKLMAKLNMNSRADRRDREGGAVAGADCRAAL